MLQQKGTKSVGENFSLCLCFLSQSISVRFFIFTGFSERGVRLCLYYFEIKIPVIVRFLNSFCVCSFARLLQTFCVEQYLQIANVEQHIIVNEDEKQHKFIFNVYTVFFFPCSRR